MSNIERLPTSGAVIPGGLALWTLDTNYFKDKLSRLIKSTSMDGPGGWFVHEGFTKDSDYLRQICSEHKVIIRDKKSRRTRVEWQPVTRHAATHFWDCEVYALAAAEMLRVFSLQPEGKMIHQPIERRTERRNSWFRQGQWMERKSNWIRKNG